jgi:hypothetical protein
MAGVPVMPAAGGSMKSIDEQLREMSDRIIEEALAESRQRAADREVADTLRRVCDQAVEAAWLVRRRRRLLREEWEA